MIRHSGTPICMRCALVISFACAVAMTGASLAAEAEQSPYERGLAALAERNMGLAIPALQKALRAAEGPAERARINLILGYCYRWDKRIDKAIGAYEAVLRDAPTMQVDLPEQGVGGLTAQVGLGYCYKAKGDLARAIYWWETQLRANPGAHAVVANALMARRKLGADGELEAGPMVLAPKSRYFPGTVQQTPEGLLVAVEELAGVLQLVLTIRPDDKQVELSSESHVLLLTAGSNKTEVDGQEVSTALAPTVVSGEYRVPLNFVAGVFGFNVAWDPVPRVATITVDRRRRTRVPGMLQMPSTCSASSDTS